MNFAYGGRNMKFNINEFKWTREPSDYFVSDERIEIITAPCSGQGLF